MYLNPQNQQQVIAHITKIMKDLKLLRQSENIGVKENGESELATRTLTRFDNNNRFDIHDLADVIKTIRTDKPLFRDDCPHFDDPQLMFLDSIESAQEMSKEKIKRFMQPTAVDSGLFARFNTRAKWLQD